MTNLAQPDPISLEAEIVDAAGSASSDKAPRSSWYALAVLIGTTLFAFVDRQIINLIAPALQRDLAITDMQLGIMQGLGLALLASISAYPIGWLSDRYGRRLVLGCCIIVWSISTGACAFQTDFTGIFVATAGIAIGEAALSPVIFSMVPDLFPERQRNTANFIFFGVVLLGAAIGLGLGGFTLKFLEENHAALPDLFAGMESWRVALILVAIPGPLFALLLTTVRSKRARGPAARSAGEPGVDLDHIRPFIRQHWRPFALIFGANFAYTLPLNAAFAWLPLALPRAFPGTQVSDIGVQLGIAVGVGTVAGLAIAPVGMKLLGGDAAIRPLRIASFLLAAASIPSLLTLLAWQPWQIYVLVGIQIMALLGSGALLPGVLQLLSPPNLRSRIISVMGIVSAVATGIGPMIVGTMSGMLDAQRGLIIGIVAVGLPGWVIGAFLMFAAIKPAAKTIATIKAAETGG